MSDKSEEEEEVIIIDNLQGENNINNNIKAQNNIDLQQKQNNQEIQDCSKEKILDDLILMQQEEQTQQYTGNIQQEEEQHQMIFTPSNAICQFLGSNNNFYIPQVLDRIQYMNNEVQQQFQDQEKNQNEFQEYQNPQFLLKLSNAYYGEDENYLYSQNSEVLEFYQNEEYIISKKIPSNFNDSIRGKIDSRHKEDIQKFMQHKKKMDKLKQKRENEEKLQKKIQQQQEALKQQEEEERKKLQRQIDLDKLKKEKIQQQQELLKQRDSQFPPLNLKKKTDKKLKAEQKLNKESFQRQNYQIEEDVNNNNNTNNFIKRNVDIKSSNSNLQSQKDLDINIKKNQDDNQFEENQEQEFQDLVLLQYEEEEDVSLFDQDRLIEIQKINRKRKKAYALQRQQNKKKIKTEKQQLQEQQQRQQNVQQQSNGNINATRLRNRGEFKVQDDDLENQINIDENAYQNGSKTKSRKIIQNLAFDDEQKDYDYYCQLIKLQKEDDESIGYHTSLRIVLEHIKNYRNKDKEEFLKNCGTQDNILTKIGQDYQCKIPQFEYGNNQNSANSIQALRSLQLRKKYSANLISDQLYKKCENYIQQWFGTVQNKRSQEDICKIIKLGGYTEQGVFDLCQTQFKNLKAYFKKIDDNKDSSKKKKFTRQQKKLE